MKAAFTAQDPDFAQRVRASFARQPAMALIGAAIERIEPGFCIIRMARRPEVTQQHGFIHGGMVGAIADSAAGYAAYSLFPAGSTVLTVEYKMNLMAPADADWLEAEGHVVKYGRTLTITRFEVFGEKTGKRVHCATGSATMMCLLDKADMPKA